MKSSSIFGFTFIILIIIFSSSSSFFSSLNPLSVNNIVYGSSSTSSLSGQNQQLIDKIALKVTEAKPSADYVSVKKVLERLALQEKNKGVNVQESLTKILNQVSSPESKVVNNIANRALKESASSTQQQPSSIQQQNQGTTQSPNNFSNRDETMVSDKAVQIDPTNIDALVKKGLALYMHDKYDEAIQSYDKALQIDPNDIDALNYKGLALSFLDRYNEAIQYYDKVLSINSSNTDALNGKGDALYNLGKYDESLPYYDKALQIDPNDTYALYSKGEALYNLGKYDESLPYYDKALQIDPSYTDVLNGKGLALHALGRYDEAIQYYDKALELDPNDTDAVNNKALTLKELHSSIVDGNSQIHNDDSAPIVKISNILEFSGENYADVEDSSDINLNSFTASLWFNTDMDATADTFLINKGIKGTDIYDNLNFALYLTQTEQISGGFETQIGDDYIITSTNSYNDGYWYHVVLTFDDISNNLKLYIDGIEVANSTINPEEKPDTTGNTPIRLGASTMSEEGNVVGGFIGQLDDIQVWEYAFTNEQVASLFDTESMIDR